MGIAGRAAYPVWNRLVESVMEVSDDMTKYRLATLACASPCIVGFLGLALLSKHVRNLELAPSDAVSRSPHSRNLLQDPKDQPEGISSGLVAEDQDPVNERLVSTILSTSLVINSMTMNTVWILWPLFVQRHYGWSDSQYSYLLLAASVSSAMALGALPFTQKHVGPGLTRVVVCALSAVCAAAAFMIKQSGGEAVHCALMLTCLFSCATLDPSLQAGISLRFLGLWHGRSFGGMAALIGIGAVLANLISTGVFDATYDTEGVLGGGSAVMLLMGCLQVRPGSAAA